MLILAAFAIAAAWTIISASRHSTAQSNCLTTFFGASSSDTVLKSEGDILCNIFPWVDVGIMGGLWVLLAIVHVRLFQITIGISTDDVSVRFTFMWSSARILLANRETMLSTTLFKTPLMLMPSMKPSL